MPKRKQYNEGLILMKFPKMVQNDRFISYFAACPKNYNGW